MLMGVEKKNISYISLILQGIEEGVDEHGKTLRSINALSYQRDFIN